MATRRWTRLAQVLASAAVLVLLARDVRGQDLPRILSEGSLGWMFAALAVKSASLTLHELRLWLALSAPRPPVARVVAIGFVAGLLNLVLPARGGDLASIGMLVGECRQPAHKATAAVGLVAFLEVAVFGLVLATMLALGASQWESLLGAEVHGRALGWSSLGTLAAIGLAIGVVVASRMFGRRPDPGSGPLALFVASVREAGTSLSSLRPLALNGGAAAVQVFMTIAAFSLALPAVGATVKLPVIAASVVLGLSALAGAVLPPSLGAGPAAASVAVLVPLGVGQASALAYAVATWLLTTVPAVVLGLPALWSRDRLRA